MGAGQRNAPVIIKRKKVIAAGTHHGGAWKVAYADFVTAMMAFFMLMWLLGATTEKQRKGIADYFNPTIPVVRASGGGSGAFGGDSIFAENSLAQNGVGAGLDRPTSDRQARGSSGTDLKASKKSGAQTSTSDLEEVQAALQGRSGESMVSELLRRHIVTRLSDEGLVIELFDNARSNLFDETDAPTPLLVTLVSHIVPVVALVTNDVAIQAHARSMPASDTAESPWFRTIRRADALRELMTRLGTTPERIRRVTGFGDRTPASQNPQSPRNARVEIILLRSKV